MTTIETLNTDNLNHAAALFDQYRIFYKQDSDLALATSFLADRLSQNNSVVFLAKHEDSYVGFTQLYPTFSSVSAQKSLILNDLYVAKQTRGLGIGQSLLDAAATYGQEIGAKGLELATAIDNTTAQALYQKNGYVQDTEFLHYFKAL